MLLLIAEYCTIFSICLLLRRCFLRLVFYNSCNHALFFGHLAIAFYCFVSPMKVYTWNMVCLYSKRKLLSPLRQVLLILKMYSVITDVQNINYWKYIAINIFNLNPGKWNILSLRRFEKNSSHFKYFWKTIFETHGKIDCSDSMPIIREI